MAIEPKRRIYDEDKDPFFITGSNPALEQDIEDVDADDKELEQNMQNEDFVAGESADPTSMSDQEIIAQLDDQINVPRPEGQPDVRNLEGMTLSKPQNQPKSLDSSFQKMLSSLDESKRSQDNDLAKAQKERRNNILGQDMSRSAALVGAGIASASPEPILNIIDKRDPHVGLPVKEYDEQIDNQKNDPNSTMSQVVKQYLGMDPNDPYSAKDLLTVLPHIAKKEELKTKIQQAMMQQRAAAERQKFQAEEAAKRQDKGIQANKENIQAMESGREKRHGENLGQRQTSQKQLDEQRDFSNLDRFQSQFNKDKIFLQAKEGLQAAETATELLSMKNPIADATTKRQLSKLSGETGMLTDKDVNDFGGSKAIKDRIEQFLESAETGTFTEQNRQYMRELTSRLKQRRSDQIKSRAMELAKQGSKKFGNKSPEEVFEFLMPGETPPGSEKKQEPKRSPQSTSQSSTSELERLDPKSGKIAVYNSDTKQFIRWK